MAPPDPAAAPASDPSAVTQVLVGIGELKTQVAVINTRITENVVPRVDDHERRLRSLERFRWTLLGGGAFAGGFVAYVVTIISDVHH